MVFKYEIGTQFKPRSGDVLVVEARKLSNLVERQYWMSNSSGDCITYFECDLDKWAAVKPFFQEGDTLKYRDENGTVLFVTDCNTAAMVKFTNPDSGNVSYAAITEWTYRMATNIQHHEV
jgi:hypothetical protein